MTTEYALESGAALADSPDEFAHLALNLIAPSLTNPRKTFDAIKLNELADSIKASGVHQPVLVRPLPGSRVQDTFGIYAPGGGLQPRPTHELVAGERRYRACTLAGVTSIPARILDLTDNQVLEIQIVENLQRDDLSALEEAEGYESLCAATGISKEDVGAKIGKSRAYVYAKLKLLDLTTEARTALRDGTIDASRALLLARIPDPKLQIRALDQVAQKDWNGDPRMSYRAAAAFVQREYMLKLDTARFKITDATLVVVAGSCKTCTKRTGHEPDLFADVNGADMCTDPTCYHGKEAAHTAQMLKTAHDNGQIVIEGREAKALMPNSWGSIEGYLRLDDQQDSPTDKPLRKLLGKQLDQDEVKPTLIANPHKDGELIAVLPAHQVAELLRAKGHNEAAERVQKDVASDRKAEASAAKAEAKKTFEQGWRNTVLTRTWAAIEEWGCPFPEPSKAVYRYMAVHFAQACNTDRAKQLCKVLELGKVAPKQGLIDYVKATDSPQNVLQLLLMHKDVEYRHWLPDDYTANEALLLIADDFHIDVEEIKTEAKKAITAKIAPEKPAIATVPAARPQDGPGGSGGKGSAPKKSTARVPKLTAEEATLGIAEAMQGIEGSASADAVAPPAEPAGESALPVGAKVQIVAEYAALEMTLRKWAEKKGVITAYAPAAEGSNFMRYSVTFRGRNGGVASFLRHQLKVLS